MSAPAPSLRLRPNARARVLAGHPWVFVNEVESPLPEETEDGTIECRDRGGRFLGMGLYNPRSQIVWRRYSRERVPLDEAFLRRALGRAAAVRAGLPAGEDGGVGRLVWSEADDLPGVVVDRYGDTLVVQIQTLAFERRSALLGDLLAEQFRPAEVIFRNDAPIRRLEGLEQRVTTRSGRRWEPRWVGIDGLEYWLDLERGQKTGFYLDQREQHAAVARHCAGKRVLDAFCNQGAFALHAARAGAAEVLGLDSAEDAIAGARENARRAGLGARFEVANVFDWFNDPARASERPWDVIILDPPPFAKSRAALDGALRGYKEINLRALRALAPGGLLATYVCSHHMHDADLRGVLAEAAGDARRKVRVAAYAHQPPDHPVLVTMPESEYLRGYLLRVDA